MRRRYLRLCQLREPSAAVSRWLPIEGVVGFTVVAMRPARTSPGDECGADNLSATSVRSEEVYIASCRVNGFIVQFYENFACWQRELSAKWDSKHRRNPMKILAALTFILGICLAPVYAQAQQKGTVSFNGNIFDSPQWPNTENTQAPPAKMKSSHHVKRHVSHKNSAS
jgi:hypothetical protein